MALYSYCSLCYRAALLCYSAVHNTKTVFIELEFFLRELALSPWTLNTWSIGRGGGGGLRLRLLHAMIRVRILLATRIFGHGHILLKVPNIEFFLMLGFRCMCTDRSKPIVKIKIMSPHHSMQMRC